MKDFQEIYDKYLQTEPSVGKIKSSTSLAIHLCKALEMDSQNEITADYFNELPVVLEDYFKNYPLRAVQDKAMLAEMIGRIGPTGNLRELFKILLTDKDENVRQYTLHSIYYWAMDDPERALPYIEKYRKSEQESMRIMAAHLAGELTCSVKYRKILDKINAWLDEGSIEFVKEVVNKIKNIQISGVEQNNNFSLEDFENWLNKEYEPKISALEA